MRPHFRLTAVLLVSLLASFAVAACDDEAEPTATPTTTASSSTPTETATVAPTATATATVTAEATPTATATPTGTPVVAADGGGVTATEVVDYEVVAPAGDIAAQQGECFSESLAAPGRVDAWRCSVGNTIYDPCFAIDETHLMCEPDPTTDHSGDYVEVADPLGAREAGDAQPWLVRVADGTICGPLTGTSIGVGDERVNYGCTNGEGILGFPTPGEPWTAEFGVPSVGASGPEFTDQHTEPLETVWR